MVQMAIEGDTLHLRVRGLDQILALRSELSVPLAHIRAVTIRPAEAHGWFHGLRFGINLPGVVTAGTFLTGDGLVFWDVHDPDKTIALDLDHEFYKRVIVEVEGPPEVAAAQIEERLQPRAQQGDARAMRDTIETGGSSCAETSTRRPSAATQRPSAATWGPGT